LSNNLASRDATAIVAWQGPNAIAEASPMSVFPAHAAPRLMSVATAVPPYELDQDAVMRRAESLFARHGLNIANWLPVFSNAGIERRFSCVPIEWYEQDHSWGDRNATYLESALELLAEVTATAVRQAGIEFSDIDQFVTVSSTGIATPSLDAMLMERLPFRDDCRRLPVFGLGCAGGVLGLNRGAQLAAAEPGSTVLVLVVELCALTFRKDDRRAANVVATALFGDGAAAAILRNDAQPGPRLIAHGETRWPGTLGVMGWNVTDSGMAVIFSRDIPALVRERFLDAAQGFLAKARIPLAEIAGFVCHPGGAKVIDALEEVFSVQRGTMVDAREVLRDFGNMSAATVMFVLERTLRRGLKGKHLLSALGPGFCAAFAVLEAA
jgi:alkylresorcinol/alkylpyrone synthase